MASLVLNGTLKYGLVRRGVCINRGHASMVAPENAASMNVSTSAGKNTRFALKHEKMGFFHQGQNMVLL